MSSIAILLTNSPVFIQRLQKILQQANYEVVVVNSDKDLLQKLQIHLQISLGILDFDSFKSPQSITNIKVKNPEAPLLICASKENLNSMNQLFSNSTQLIKVSWEVDDSIFKTHIERLAHLAQRLKENNTDLCPLSHQFLSQSKLAPCDIYVKLSQQKFLKILHQHDPIIKEELDKFMAKENSLLYIKISDFEKITAKIGEKTLSILERAPFDSHRWTLLAQFGQQSSLQMIWHLGITDHALSMVENTLTSIDKIISSNTSLKKIFASLSRDKYAASHGVALAILLAQMTQNCEKTLDRSYSDKFTFAAIFHDIAIAEDNLCRIQFQTDQDFAGLSSSQKKMILDHPMLAVEKLNKVRGIPADVNKIIEQHHETPDGTGFPNGLNYQRLHFLSSFFMVGHHFVDQLLNTDDGINQLTANLEQLKSIYHQDNFAQAIKALELTIKPALLEQKNVA